MTNEQKASSEFEHISEQIVNCLFEEKDVDIIATKPTKDGGYDIVVECHDGETYRRAFFECKLRGKNLNLRDIAANVIIAFNHGATAFVAITNHNFTKQLGEEIGDFAQHTVLNIKIIVGDELQHIFHRHNLQISETLQKCLTAKEKPSHGSKNGEFQALRIQFDKDIFSQLFYRQNEPEPVNLFWDKIFQDLPEKIYHQITAGRLVMLSGYSGIGKHLLAKIALSRTKKRVIRIDACLHDTRDPLIVEVLSKIWGIPEPTLFKEMQKTEIHEIAHWIGTAPNSEEIKHDLAALLNENVADKRTSAQQNALFSNYIANLVALHRNDIGYCFLIENLQFSTKEVYDFLVYLIKRISDQNFGCVVLYNENEYSSQGGTDPRSTLQRSSNYQPLQLSPMTPEMAEYYLIHIRPELSQYAARMIIRQIGVRHYNLEHTLHYLFEIKNISPHNHVDIAKAISNLTPNDIPGLIAQLLPSYQEKFPELFGAFFLFDGKVPLHICTHLGLRDSDLDSMVSAGILKCEQGMILPHNELILSWIRQKYTLQSPSICLCAEKTLGLLKDQDKYIPEQITLYHALGKHRAALELIERDLNIQIRDRQYTVLLRELILAVDLARKIHDDKLKLYYLSQLLELYVVIKQITSDEAREYLDEFRRCLAYTSHPTHLDYALAYFDLKRDFKLGHYSSAYSSVSTGAIFFRACVAGEAIDNTDDWLGRLCGCYALIIKSTQGNQSALSAFEQIKARLPDSFEIHREYLSHLACMELFAQPEQAYSHYQEILGLFQDKTPNFAELPFHEYGDLAMSLLLAGRLEEARQKCEEAIRISQSNGLLDEEGRNLNIWGCIKLCQNEWGEARRCFREATATMRHAGCRHYAWRSELNDIQLRIIDGESGVPLANELGQLYIEFKTLLEEKIRALTALQQNEFRQTREYHALLVLGFCLTKIKVEEHSASSIPKEFGLSPHTDVYLRDLASYLSGTVCIQGSPYFHKKYIFTIG